MNWLHLKILRLHLNLRLFIINLLSKIIIHVWGYLLKKVTMTLIHITSLCLQIVALLIFNEDNPFKIILLNLLIVR